MVKGVKRPLVRPYFEILLLAHPESQEGWQWIQYCWGRTMGSSRGKHHHDTPGAALQDCLSEWPCTDPTQHLK